MGRLPSAVHQSTRTLWHSIGAGVSSNARSYPLYEAALAAAQTSGLLRLAGIVVPRDESLEPGCGLLIFDKVAHTQRSLAGLIHIKAMALKSA